MLAGLVVIAVSCVEAGLEVSPVREEVTLPPGGTFTGSYKVTNDLGKPATYNVEDRYWYFPKEEENIKLSDWLTVYPSSFTFKPGETVEEKYTIHISTVVSGMRVAMISFVPSEPENGISLMISVSLYVTVKGTEKIDWDFSNFRIMRWNGDAQLSVDVSDKGNVHIRPSGVIKISGKKKTVLTIPENLPVYPGKTRQILTHCVDKDAFPKPGKYTIEVSITSGNVTKVKKYKVKLKESGELIIK
jgi:hypothetical protein